jgi:hypothetical protein
MSRSSAQAAYWLVTGALFGVGCITILSIGLLLVALGVAMLTAGLIRKYGGGWAALAGFGGAPAAILLWDVTSAPWACQPVDGAAPTQPNVNYYSCVDTFAGHVTTYHVLAFGFGLVALLGLAWPLGRRLWRRLRFDGPAGQRR